MRVLAIAGAALAAIGVSLIATSSAFPTAAATGISSPGSAAGFFLLLAGLALVGTSLQSSIHDERGLVRLAQEATRDQQVQQEMDDLLDKLLHGNAQAGLGASRLPGTDISYMRGRNGARLFYRQHGDDYQVIGKSSKKNEDQVIRKLRELYGH